MILRKIFIGLFAITASLVFVAEIFAKEDDPVPKFKELRITTQHINHLTYGNGKYVAVGNNGFIATSTDMKNWQTQSSPVAKNLKYVIYDGNPKRFVAVGQHRTILVSDDGVNWSQRIGIDTTNNRVIESIVYDSNNIKFIAYSRDTQVPWSSALVKSINNGDNWTVGAYSSSALSTGNMHDVIIFRNLYIVAAHGTNDSSDNRNGGIRTSTSGESNWVKRYGTVRFTSLAKNDSETLVVAVGYNGNIATSTNGTSWTTRSSGVTSNLNQVAYHDGYFYVTGDGGVFLRSKDGIAWERLEDLNVDVKKIHSLNGSLLINGNNGLIKIEFYNGVAKVNKVERERSINFSWDMIDNSVPAVTKIYMGNDKIAETSSRFYVVEDLEPDTAYTFKFVSDDGVEKVVNARTTKLVKEVQQLRAAPSHNRVNLSWKNPTYDDFSHVTIYRKELANNSAINTLLFGKTVSANGYNPIFETNGTYFNDLTVKYDTSYEYKLTTVSESGLETNGVTIQVTTLGEPAPSMGGVIGEESENGDYIYKWTSPTTGTVKVMVGGKEYAVVPASDGTITIPASEMKYTMLGAPDVRLIPISESGKVGNPTNPNSIVGSEKIGFSPNDVLDTSMGLLFIVGPFVLLALAFMFVPRLIELIRQATKKKAADMARRERI